MIANRSGHYLDMKIKERKFYLCTDLKFDFEAQKWTDDKMGLQIVAFSRFLVSFIFKPSPVCK